MFFEILCNNTTFYFYIIFFFNNINKYFKNLSLLLRAVNSVCKNKLMGFFI